MVSRAAKFAIRALISIGIVIGITIACYRWIPVNATTTGFAYLIAVLGIATVWGLAEAILSSTAAMLLFNYYFFHPIGTLTVSDAQNWVALFAFLATALVASQLSERLKRQRAEAISHQQEMERLYSLSRALLMVDTSQPPARRIIQEIAKIFDQAGVAIYDRATAEIYHAGAKSTSEMNDALRAAAHDPTFSQEHHGRAVVPIRLGEEPIGSLALAKISFSDAALQSVLNLVAISLERVRAEAMLNRAEVARQSEELKSTLLDAIAHEFKSPLTSIKAVTTDMLDSESRLSPGDRELITIVDEEADRLSMLVTEAIQLARIEGGKFPLNKAPHFPQSLVASAMREMKSVTEGREIVIQIHKDIPAVFADADLVKMVLRLLLDNALKYSRSQTPIVIEATERGGLVTVSVADQGPGIPIEEQGRIFEKFHRYLKDHPHTSGTGMGLAIAREILRLHGGEISVESAPGFGSRFQFWLPIAPLETIK